MDLRFLTFCGVWAGEESLVVPLHLNLGLKFLTFCGVGGLGRGDGGEHFIGGEMERYRKAETTSTRPYCCNNPAAISKELLKIHQTPPLD